MTKTELAALGISAGIIAIGCALFACAVAGIGYLLGAPVMPVFWTAFLVSGLFNGLLLRAQFVRYQRAGAEIEALRSMSFRQDHSR